MSQKGSAALLILLTLVLIIILVVIYLLFISKHISPQFLSTPTPPPVLQVTPSPIPTPNPIQSFTKRHFDPNEEYAGTKIFQPIVLNQLEAIDEQSLLAMSCGPEISVGNDEQGVTNLEYLTSESQNQWAKLSDNPAMLSKLQPLISLIEKNRKPNFGATALPCLTENGLNLALVNFTDDLSSTKIYYTFYQNGQTPSLKTLSNIPAGVYFGCTQVLQLSTSHQLDIQCSQGDGTTGFYTYYRVNLEQNTVKKLAACTMEVSDQPPIVTCQ
jgi:hypothetical protein